MASNGPGATPSTCCRSSAGPFLTNRLALSIAGLWWGGEESYTLLAADCATAKAEQVEAWTPPTDHRLEQRSKAPAAFLTWLRYAENAVKVFGSAYGLEHVPERLAFLSFLRRGREWTSS